MKILIIGGTRFLGRHLVHAALERGHEVTLFNRGLTNPDLFLQLETILGDREKDLPALMSGEWDAAIDTCGYVPRIVRLSAEGLEANVGRYAFISSISVYADFRKIGIDETYPLAQMPVEPTEDNGPETYGPRKALCEKAVEESFGAERTVIVRPGLIAGPYDPTDRFTYWLVRVQRGGDVLAPEGPAAPIQIIDVRDLAEFIVGLVEREASGCFNATGPGYELTMGELLETSKRVSGSDANIVWAPLEFLARHEVAPWSDLPVWIPNVDKDAGFSHIDISRAVRAGLAFRPLEETVRDTLAWAATRPPERELRAGLSAEREAELLAALKGE